MFNSLKLFRRVQILVLDNVSLLNFRNDQSIEFVSNM